ncbi:MAG: hypothetical protein WCK05_12120 [Planctomycetota bacterium]
MTFVGYHGTEATVVSTLLVPGKIDREQGRGELGRGFYLGNWLFVAKAWAWNRCISKPNKPLPGVLRVTVAGDRMRRLVTLPIGLDCGRNLWRCLLQTNQTKTFVFRVDIVTSPLLGNPARIQAGIQGYVTAMMKSGPPPAFLLLQGQPIHTLPLAYRQWKWESKQAENTLNAKGTDRRPA